MSFFWSLLIFAEFVGAIVHLQVRRDLQGLPRLARRDASGNDSQGTIDLSLGNSISYYKTELLIGNPPQRVDVQIDTGSSDLWVISTSNPLCESVHATCAWKSTFDSDRSETFRSNRSQPFGITYGDSTFASGYFAQDDIGLGGDSRQSSENVIGEDPPDGQVLSAEDVAHQLRDSFGRLQSKNENESSGSNAFTITSANFALADRANSSEAVWGIGMESTESVATHINSEGEFYPTYPNLPVQMKQQGLIDTVSYSLWLNDLRASTGSLLFGGVDHAKYTGSLQRVPLVSSYQNVVTPVDFSIILNGISVYNSENESVELVHCSLPVLLDSGTTYCQLPMQLIEPIAKMLGAYHDKKANVFLLSATKRKQVNGGVAFNMSGISIEVSLDELLIPLKPLKPSKSLDDGDYNSPSIAEATYELSESKSIMVLEDSYLLGIIPLVSGSQGAYILGDTFLRSAYVVYDLENKEIALANAVQNSSTSSIEKIDSNGIPSAVKASMYSATKVSTEIVTYSASNIFSTEKGVTTADIVGTGTQTLSDAPIRSVFTGTSLDQTTVKSAKGRGHRNCGNRILRVAPIWVLAGALLGI